MIELRIAARFLWSLLGVVVLLRYGYYGAMFAGAYFGWNEPPNVSLDWMALGMFGAMFMMGNFIAADWKKIVENLKRRDAELHGSR